jgi:hypothetical protein
MTHQHGEIVRRVPFLIKESAIFGITVPYYRIVQHLSTTLGALTISIYALKSNLIPAPSSNPLGRRPAQKLIFWSAGGIIAFAFACLAVWPYHGYSIFQIDRRLLSYPISSTFGLAGWAGFFYFVCIYSLIKKYFFKRT